MDTLSDVTRREDGIILPDTGFAADAPPGNTSSQTGESVRYARRYDKAWFVLRITYSRERKAYDHIVSQGVEAYLPMHHYVEKTTEKPIRIKSIIKPLIPGIIFVYTTKKIVDSFIKGSNRLDCITAYYNHFSKNAQGYNDYLVVPGNQMDNFMRLASVMDKHIKLVNPEQCRYKSGDTVIIKEGKFKGITGRVARVSGQQRVIVTLDGVCSIATAYIPTAFLGGYAY